MMNDIIEATILNVKFIGEDVLLPRIPMILPDMSFKFKRLNDHQQSTRTSLLVCGLNLENPCFSHGQLYLACSRIGKPSDLFVYTPERKTKNIIYSKALQ
jgi:ATP-dependent DNA helicase PIF1